MIIGGYHSCSLCDYPGRVSAVVFTQGCNFRCPFCHNGSLLPMAPQGCAAGGGEIIDRLKQLCGRIDGVVISGGEPTLHEDLKVFVESIRSTGLAVKLDTNGSRPEIIGDLIRAGLIDYIAMDIKAPLEKYEKLAGVRVPAGTISESIDIISRYGIAHEFRTTFVPALLTGDDLAAVRAMIPAGSPHRIQPFKPDNALDKRLRTVLQ